jgi:hypothetical protein
MYIRGGEIPSAAARGAASQRDYNGVRPNSAFRSRPRSDCRIARLCHPASADLGTEAAGVSDGTMVWHGIAPPNSLMCSSTY